MNFPNDEDLFRQIRNSYDTEPSPEFLQRLENKLSAKTRKHHRRRRNTLLIVRWGLSAAAFLLFANIFLQWQGMPAPVSHDNQAASDPTKVAPYEIKEDQVSKVGKQTLDQLYKKYPLLKKATKSFQVSGQTYDIEFRVWENKTVKLYATATIHSQSGKLLAFSDDTTASEDNSNEANAPSEEVAKKQAEAFLRAMIGNSTGLYKLEEVSSDQGLMHLQYNRYVNNLLVVGDRYTIGVKGNGDIAYMNAGDAPVLITDSNAFPKPADVMDKAEAQRALAGHLQLKYVPKGKTGDDKHVYELRYVRNFSGYLSAQTGEEVKTAQSFDSKLFPATSVTAGAKKVTAKTPEEAAAALVQFGVNAQGVVFKANSVPAEMRDDQSEGQFEARLGNKIFRVMTLGSRVVGFDVADIRGSSKGKKLSDQEVQEKALAFLQTYLDENVTELIRAGKSYQRNPSENPRVTFYRSYQGIPIDKQTYTVTVDQATGEITGLRLSVTDPNESFADASKAITPEAAAAAYVQTRPLELQYIFPQVNSETQAQPVLVYALTKMNEAGSVDALNGIWRETK